tara:strand:+ start:267 stop:530 length:264 start_codon:yes stop_codon:yes gene_type:complete
VENFVPPGDCPVCGEHVEEGFASCQSCGSCPQSGWSVVTAYDGLDLPAESFGEWEDVATKGKSTTKRLVLAAALLIGVVILFVLTKP